ncbi:MAG TPA: GMC oxidoreductase [Cellvibrio sp.]|nr:GMC oxidoreductase [Cellvibrio sp.]
MTNYRSFFSANAGNSEAAKNVVDTQPNNNGYPCPGPQNATAEEIARSAFFMKEQDWSRVQNEHFDFIVVGTGPTALAFIEQTLAINGRAKILVLERGGYWLPSHYQMLPMALQATTGTPTTTYPWSRTKKMATEGNKFSQAGYIPQLGGRSTYWSAWCPSPDAMQLRDWPQQLIAVTQQENFWQRARDFLHVTSTDEIQDAVYGKLQAQITQNLKHNLAAVPSATEAFAAPIAVGKTDWQGVKFYKFSTVGTLLGLQQKQQQLENAGTGAALTIVDRCVVDKLEHDGKGVVTKIHTSRGAINVGTAQIVLGMGTIPPATLLMNSFAGTGLLVNAGKRYTGHFMSHVIARIKRSEFTSLAQLEIGATYLAGTDKKTGLQYHVQTSAFASKNPVADANTIALEAPDAAAVATPEQLQGSEDYVVFVCATLGEVSEKNPDNWLRLTDGSDPTTNLSIQLGLSETDQELWNVLDEATYQTISAMTEKNQAVDVEYWTDANGWQTARPTATDIRLPIIVHEASPLWIGTDPATSVVGLDYRPHGVKNVYVTGGSLFPTSGSWNPTLTMCGFAQDLAEKLNR